jgi:hypothetical protein
VTHRDFTVCVLLYGEHTTLAKRCLDSIMGVPWLGSVNIVIGMNAVCEDTRQFVYDTHGNRDGSTVFDSEKNLCKYPMMRHMFYDETNGALLTEHVMWFDDDSYIIPGGVATNAGWLSLLRQDMQTRGDMLGSKFTLRWQGDQKQWVRQQPWYNPDAGTDTKLLTFITGGWWVAKSAMLRACGYPWQSLSHNGGDSMFGEMCRHTGYKQGAYVRGGVAINADEYGVSHIAKRRGVSEPVIGKYSTAGKLAAVTTPIAGGNIVTCVSADGLMHR